jgi:hypothetical protein
MNPRRAHSSTNLETRTRTKSNQMTQKPMLRAELKILGLKPVSLVLLGGRINYIGKPSTTAAAAGSAGYSSMKSFFEPLP